jgi:hypothetical protein
MKNKYLIGAAVLSLAILGGGAALAQTPPGAGNDNANVPSAIVGNGQNNAVPGQNNLVPRYGMMGGVGGRGSYNTGNIGGRRMTGVRAPSANTMSVRAAHVNVGFTAWHIFASAVTILLVWAFLVLVILTLLQHLKMCRCKCKAEKDEAKK